MKRRFDNTHFDTGFTAISDDDGSRSFCGIPCMLPSRAPETPPPNARVAMVTPHVSPQRHKQEDQGGKRAKNPTEGEMLLTKELNSMSLQERNTLHEEIHGILPHENGIEGNEPAMSECVEQLIATLAKTIRRSSKDSITRSYEMAHFLSPEYVHDRKFLLLFLRADHYNVAQALQRVLAFFQLKMELFGLDKLVKPIGFLDLDAETQEAVRLGAFQLFPNFRDTVGRYVGIWVSSIAHERVAEWRTNIKAGFYILTNFLERHESVQTNGLVGIAYNVGLDPKASSTDNVRQSSQLLNAVPVRYGAFHMCYDDPNIKMLVSLLQMLLAYQTRIRFRSHFGSHVECKYAMMQFGIPNIYSPIDEESDTVVTTDHFWKYMLDQFEYESQRDAKYSELILQPSSRDVLFRRNRIQKFFPGNQLLHATIESYLNRYRMSSKDEKTVIAETIVMMQKETGGRFLKRSTTGDGWVVVQDVAARERISQLLRTRIRDLML